MILNRIQSLLTFSALCLTLSACSGAENTEPPAGQRDAAVRILAAPVTMKRNFQRIEAVGTSRARQAATIYAQGEGEVVSIGFSSGQYVKAGHVLAQLENAEERFAVSQAEIAVEDANQLLARYEKIITPGAIAGTQVDAARTAVSAAKVRLDIARDALSRRTVRAPFSGYVGLTEVDPGARITPQTEITRIDDRSILYVDFSVPEQVFGEIAQGDILPMQPFAATDEPVSSEVLVVDSRIDPQKRSFTVRAKVDNQADTLRPGMSFRVDFQLPGNELPAVPEAAIVWGGDGAYLWAVRDGKAERMTVTIVARNDGEVLVDAPLVEGDLIIAEGVQKVREGVRVEDVRPLEQRSAPLVIEGMAATRTAVQ